MTEALYLTIGFWVMVTAAVVSPFIIARWMAWFHESRLHRSRTFGSMWEAGLTATFIAAAGSVLLWVAWIGLLPASLVLGVSYWLFQRSTKNAEVRKELVSDLISTRKIRADLEKLKAEILDSKKWLDQHLTNSTELK